MFIKFFYDLKKECIPVSLSEWLTLIEALAKGLAFSSLTGFYYLSRAVWLNPVPSQWWGREPDFTTINMVKTIFPMYELNLKGLEQAIEKIRIIN